MEERYDIAIIGSGPAGLSSAINAKIRNKNIIVFGNKDLSNKLMRAPKIDNYLGFYGISGKELKEKFDFHINKMGIEINDEKITSVYSMGEYFALMANEKMYESKSLIIAMGMESIKSLKGEEEFLGKGVGYCATCDAPLYKGKTVVVIAYNKEAEEEANFTSEIVEKLYYLPMYKGEYNINSNIEIVKDTPIEIVGKDKVEKIVLKNGEIKADGVFILKDSIPAKELVPGIEVVDGHINVNKNMETNIAGCYAAGDCAGKPYQYMKSTGEGQVAALNAVSYLNNHDNKN